MVKMEKRIGPILNVKAIYDRWCGRYPSRVKVAMLDGKVRTFWDEVLQPKPKPWNPLHEIIGYPVQAKYQPRHTKK